jgi:hypothetical protein
MVFFYYFFLFFKISYLFNNFIFKDPFDAYENYGKKSIIKETQNKKLNLNLKQNDFEMGMNIKENTGNFF